MSTESSSTADREIAQTHTFDAPRELVWKVWTDPAHIGQWWGPHGFTTTTFSYDLRPGGIWRFVMHGPDGTDYQNKVTFVEVVERKKLIYKHGGDGDKKIEPVNFIVTVTFDEVPGGKTRMHWQMLFPNAAAKKFTVEKYGADKGLVETISRLEEHLRARPFVISRTFDAPRELVWRAWTERDRLKQWFGPKGMLMTTANLDFRVGGKFHYALKMPDGSDMWGRFIYREIDPPNRLVWVNSFSDPSGAVARHFAHESWPLEMLTTVTFVEHQGKTTVTVNFAALNATSEEQATFDKNHDSMRGGWGGTFEQLGEYLSETKG